MPAGYPAGDCINHRQFALVSKDVLKAGTIIVVAGRAIPNPKNAGVFFSSSQPEGPRTSKDVSLAADEFPEQLDREEIDRFTIMTIF